MTKSIFLIVGDSFLVREKVSSLLSALKNSCKNEVSQETFYLSENPIGQILERARTLPFLVEKQFFVINQIDKIKKEEADTFLNYVGKPNADTVIVLCGDKIDKRSVFYKALGKEKVVETTVFEESEQVSASHRYIVQKLKQFEKKMDARAQRRLEQMVGDSPAFLDSILSQLILYSGSEDVLTEEMLSRFEEKIGGIDVFEFTNAIAEKRTDLALGLFNAYMQENGTDIFSLMGLLHWQLRRLWQVSVYLEEGSDSSSISKKCRISPGQIKYVISQIKKLPRKKIESAIENLFLLDQGIKTGEAQDKMGLERWIVELTA